MVQLVCLQIVLGQIVAKPIISPFISRQLVNILVFVKGIGNVYSEACGNIMDPKIQYETRYLLEIELKLQEQEAKEGAKEVAKSEESGDSATQPLAQAILESATQEEVGDSAQNTQEAVSEVGDNTLFSLEA